MVINPKDYDMERYPIGDEEIYLIPNDVWDKKLINHFSRVYQRAWQDDQLYSTVYPNAKKRVQQLYHLKKSMLKGSLLSPQTICLCTSELDGLAVWLLEKEGSVLESSWITIITKGGGIPMLISSGISSLKRILEVMKYSSQLKTPHPRYCLFQLAIDSNVQSCGKGTLLMDAFFSMNREHPDWAFYLESSNDRTAKYYQKWGFKTMDKKIWRGNPLRSMVKTI